MHVNHTESKQPYIGPERTIDGKESQVVEDSKPTNNSALATPDDLPTYSQVNQGDCNMTQSTNPLCTIEGDRRKTRLPVSYYAVVVILIQIVNAVEVSYEYNFDYFIPTYLNKGPPNLSKDVSAHLASVLGSAYAVGRFISMLMSVKTGVHRIIYGSVLLLLVSNILAFYCPPGRLDYLGPLIFLYGLGFSSLYPSMLTFIEERINITNTLNATMLCLSTALFCGNSVLIGSTIEKSPQLFIYLNIFYTLMFLVMFVLLHFTDLLKKYFLGKTQ
jgi:MFS family permease